MTIHSTPWGPAQSVRMLAQGIALVSTAGHGGIKLSPERQAQMPASCRTTPYSSGGWYEEDCDILMPIYRFYSEVGPHVSILLSMVESGLKSNVRYYTEQRLRDLGVL
jgi:hypothetical protein